MPPVVPSLTAAPRGKPPAAVLRWLAWVVLAALVAAAAPGPARAQAAGGTGVRVLEVPGVRLEYTPQDAALAARLAPVLSEDRATVTERLRLFPTQPVTVRLAPTTKAFKQALGDLPAAGTLGVYLLGTRTIVVRSPRTLPGGDWDPREVLRHEMAHAVIDMAIDQPVPLWLHEGLAILVSDGLDYLDEAQLTTVAVLGRLIPLPVLFNHFPRTHGARGLAYAQAASFVRFLLRQGRAGTPTGVQGIGNVQALLKTLARGVPPQEAFLVTYGETLDQLEARWRKELAGRFSIVTLVTTTSVLGGLGIPLLLLGLARRWVQRRRAYRQWEAEERLRAAVRAGLWAPAPHAPRTEAPDVAGSAAPRPAPPGALGGWRRPGEPGDRRPAAPPPAEPPTDGSS